jgi:ABC-type transport system involved in multi-copper enzyme maturation permease subunit
MIRTALARYSPWQFRDFVMERGIAIAIIGMLWGYLSVEPLRRTMGAAFGANPSPVWPLIITVVSSVASLSVLIALNGIVSTDRKTGYYRFLFSKPVSAVAYYAQLFFVYMVGVLIVLLLLSGVLHMVIPAFRIFNFLLYTAIIYIAMGGIGFFVSVVTRFDWLTLAAVWVGSRVLRNVYGSTPGWKSKAVELLPPVHKIDDLSLTLITSGTAHTSDVLWLVGYGALFFALGLLVLRRGSLAD